jgi:hypothetical protein
VAASACRKPLPTPSASPLQSRQQRAAAGSSAAPAVRAGPVWHAPPVEDQQRQACSASTAPEASTLNPHVRALTAPVLQAAVLDLTPTPHVMVEQRWLVAATHSAAACGCWGAASPGVGCGHGLRAQHSQRSEAQEVHHTAGSPSGSRQRCSAHTSTMSAPQPIPLL